MIVSPLTAAKWLLTEPTIHSIEQDKSHPTAKAIQQLREAIREAELTPMAPLTARRAILRFMLDQHLDCWHTVGELQSLYRDFRDITVGRSRGGYYIRGATFASALSTMGRSGILERRKRSVQAEYGNGFRDVFEYRAGVIAWDTPPWSPPPLRYGWQRTDRRPYDPCMEEIV